MEWKQIKTAPKDGTVFIGRNADHPNWGSYPMMRRVKYQWNDDAYDFVMTDLGAWLLARGNEINTEDGGDSGQGFPYSIAMDEYNKSVRYEWMPMPNPPETR